MVSVWFASVRIVVPASFQRIELPVAEREISLPRVAENPPEAWSTVPSVLLVINAMEASVTPMFISAVPNFADTCEPTAPRRAPSEENMKSPVTETVSASENFNAAAATSKYSPRLPLLSSVTPDITTGVDNFATVVFPEPSP